MIIKLLPVDKQGHMLVGLFVYVAVYIPGVFFFPEFADMAGVTMAGIVGLWKEASDKRTGGHVEGMDFIATLAGGLLGFVCGFR